MEVEAVADNRQGTILHIKGWARGRQHLTVKESLLRNVQYELYFLKLCSRTNGSKLCMPASVLFGHTRT